MTVKNRNEDGQTRYVKRYLTDKLFSRIVGSLCRSYVLRHPRSTYAWWIWIDWSEGCMKVEGHLLACSGGSVEKRSLKSEKITFPWN